MKYKSQTSKKRSLLKRIGTIARSTLATIMIGELGFAGYTFADIYKKNNISYKEPQAISAQENPGEDETGQTRETKQNRLEQTVETEQKTVQTETKTRSYQDPKYKKDDNFAADTDTMILARAIYGEARGQIEIDKDYVYGVARSIINRSNKSGEVIKNILVENNKKKLKSGKIINVYAYSCFDPRDKNLAKIKDPDKKLFEKCYDIAEQAINGTYIGNQALESTTNYFVSKADPSKNLTKAEAIKNNIPGWAYEMKDGKFIKNIEGKRIPRKPITTINLSNGRTARFYSFKQF